MTGNCTSLTQLRRQRDLDRHNRNLTTSWNFFNKAAFHYDPNEYYNEHQLIQIGRMNVPCKYCNALKWKKETDSMCCCKGKVYLEKIQDPPEPLNSLLSYETAASRHFLDNIRCYNSCFQMTSFGADREVNHTGFSPSFIIQGQVYHKIGTLLPLANEEHKFLQIYFMGNNDN